MTRLAMAPALHIDDVAYFDRLREVEADHWWSAGMWRIASHWLDRWLRGRSALAALDVGCGAAGTLGRLSARAEIATVVGLDPSPYALAHARREDVVLGSALNLPFPDASFDVTTSFDVLQHLPPGGDRVAAAEMLRVLRPGGLCVIRANGRGLWPDPQSESRPYRLGELRELMRSVGFRVRAATYANCLPAVAVEVAGRLRRELGMTPSHLRHPSGGGLRIRPASPVRNRLMGAISGAEAMAVGRLRIVLPVGHSTMLMLEKRSVAPSSGGHR
ncbi:MAG: methylase involved in ubiquinone/menaquinone biosynthesis [Planctomycetota bacterium]|nr:methylase involved in ubiquinone/menaquinone biosynthesis [Planctomycetota bacterium]